MSRVKRGVTAHARHKKVLSMAKGYRGRNKNVFRVAVEKVEKALQYAYRDRRTKKRNFRSLWIQRINAAARANGMSYSEFMGKVNAKGILNFLNIIPKIPPIIIEKIINILDL